MSDRSCRLGRKWACGHLLWPLFGLGESTALTCRDLRQIWASRLGAGLNGLDVGPPGPRWPRWPHRAWVGLGPRQGGEGTATPLMSRRRSVRSGSQAHKPYGQIGCQELSHATLIRTDAPRDHSWQRAATTSSMSSSSYAPSPGNEAARHEDPHLRAVRR